MPTKHETLAEFVSRVMGEKKLSFRKVSERTGGQISHSTVADIANAQRFDIKKDTLIALARGLDVAAEDVFRVARGLAADNISPYEIYAERFDAHDLSETEWQLLETYFNDQVQSFLQARADRQRMIDELKQAPPRQLAPVVATITPGKKLPPDEMTREQIQRTINTDQENEIKRRITPRKKKTG